MVKSLFTGVSGLKSHQQRMDVIGNNIANVNTVGYKTDVVTFADVYYQTKRSPSGATATLGGINPRQAGYGVRVSAVTANFSQSGYNYTDSKTDIALDGKGFFQLMDGAGNIYYTRAGNFTFDDAGYLVNADGYHVLGVSGNTEGVGPSSDVIRAVIPATDAHVSSATKKVNGTNVTVSVSAPSEYTNMSVAFSNSRFPYATYANGTLTIYINTEEQYNTEFDFQEAVRTALTAGGVNLPDDVELSVSFDPIPDDVSAKRAMNKVENLKFTSEKATLRFHASKTTTSETYHTYIDFAVNDNSNTDTVKLTYGGQTGVADAKYDATNKTWTINIFDDTTAGDINKAISDELSDPANLQAPQLKCTAFVIPSDLPRREAIQVLTGGTAPASYTVDGVGSGNLRGAAPDKVSGMFDFGVQEAGEFGNNYVIQFATKTAYGKTSVSWEENTLTVNICPDTTLEDINLAIIRAAGGDPKRIIRFYDIEGIDFGSPLQSLDENGDIIYQYAGGYDFHTGDNKWYDKYGNEVTDTTEISDKLGSVPTGGAKVDKDPADLWNVGMKQEFFGGNPRVSPMDGEDSFYTKTAKSLSTFLLQDGRLGDEQAMHNFEDYMIQSDGTIIGLHKIYGYMVLGRVDIATFDNPNGLAKAGGTNFKETVASGPAYINRAGENGAGLVVPNALEMSNVDLADEFTNMIATQRGYQANSRVVTVSDTMIEELLNLKR